MRQQNPARVLGVLDVHLTVAGDTANRDGGEGFVARIDSHGMAARALVCERIGLPMRRARVGRRRLRLLTGRMNSCREHVESAVGLRSLQKTPLICAAKNKLRDFRERCKALRGLKQSERFRVDAANRGLMPVLRPRRTDLDAVAKQTFIASNRFRDGFAHVVGTPRGRIQFSPRAGRRTCPKREAQRRNA